MSGTKVMDKPVDVTDDAVKLDGPWQVVLFNDDHNTAEFVVECLMRVFGHPEQMAVKIMFEAHAKGRSIAEVEDREDAQLHKDQLQSYGLTAETEQI
jgi:ATP-dependent Clp protease adaptor protein ClpS